ncbi:MAG: M28 family peptidase, partial [Thermoproteota archaeon]
MLKDKKVSGEITSLMQWETKIASNIVGILNGTTLGEEAVSLWAFFDSSSIVPSLAPGADAASGISVLLELARILSENRPARTIIFTALSGHFQSLLGAREFVDKYMFTDKGRNILLTIGLDLSTDSNSMALYYGGRSFYSPGFDPERFYRVAELLFYLGTRREFPDERYRDMNVGDQSLLGVLMATTRQIYYVGDGLLQTGGRFVQRLASVPTGLMIDTEPLAMANGMALSFSTSGSYRSRWETPFDTLEYWKLENLKPQAEFILSALYLLANIRNLRGWVPETTLTRFDPIHALGFSTLKGMVMEYDQMKGVYAPVPNALVYAEAFLFRHRLIALANDNGEFEMIGLRPQTEYSVKAYLIDSKTGNPVYAPDMGQYAVTFANSFTVSREKELKTFIVFKAGSIGLPGITEPRSKETSITFSIYDASSHAMPFSYGYDLGSPFTLTEITPSSLETSVSVIFAPPWEPVEITTEIGGKIFGVINNGSIGYKVEAGKLVLIPMLPLQMAREMHRLNSERLGIVHEYGIFSAGGFAESFLAKGRFMIEQALTALNDQRYGEAYSHSIDAWINEANAYLEIKNLITDVASTIVFLGLILAPFSLSAERLFIHSQKGPVRFTVTFLFFSLPLMLLYFIHPGFVLASNAFMAVLGAGVLVLNVPVIAMLLTESLSYASQIKEKLMGHHTLAASKVSTFLLALSTGIESMRKRKLRTGFTLITIMMIVFSLTSLTSLYATRSTVVIPSPVGKALYDGLLLRMPRWEQLSRELYRDMQLKFGKDAAVSPRAWWFPNFYESPRLFLRGSTEVLALWGLMPEEEKVSGLWSRARIDGRWLTENDSWVCIVSDDVSKGTHMTLGDEVELLGFRFTVVGIINGTIAASLSDMDGESITPVNFEMVKPEIEEFPHLSSSFIIIPFQTLLKMGGQCYSIAIKFKEYISISVKEVASELIFSTPTDIYVTSQGGTSIYRVGGVFIFGGAESFVILTALAILILFDAVLGNLYEKTKEIPIYSSLGLSPTGVGGMHLVENLIHAFIGGFIGYMGGVLGIRFFQLLEVIPPGISINLYG